LKKYFLVYLLILFVFTKTAHTANDFYTPTGNPATASSLSSALMRAEFSAIEDGFDKGPTLTGNGLKYVRVNTGGTALEAVTAATVAGDHDIADHADTTGTGAELESLTDGSDASSLHNHTTANLNDTTATGANLNTMIGGAASDASALHTHNSGLSNYLPLSGGSMTGDINMGDTYRIKGTTGDSYLKLPGFGSWLLMANNNYSTQTSSWLAVSFSDLSTGKGLVLQHSGSTKGSVKADSSGNLYLGASNNIVYVANLFPETASTYDLGSSSARFNYVYLVNSPDVSSDIRLKKDVKNLSSMDVDWLYNINPIFFNWKSGGDRSHYGFSAQEMYGNMPDKRLNVAKKIDLEDGGFEMSMSPTELIAPMLKLIQDQKNKIDKLSRRIEAIELIL
jgi:hypothetical protein